jgi:hypothetical protein
MRAGGSEPQPALRASGHPHGVASASRFKASNSCSVLNVR